MLGDMAAEVWRESDIALISPSADAPLYLLMREVVVCTEGAAGPGPRAVVQPVGDWSGEPRVLVPAHCTGWRAVHSIAARFPDAFIQNSVGTTYVL
jgi:hypothetical protein